MEMYSLFEMLFASFLTDLADQQLSALDLAVKDESILVSYRSEWFKISENDEDFNERAQLESIRIRSDHEEASTDKEISGAAAV